MSTHPEPGDTARLDQLAAVWRDAPAAARDRVHAAAMAFDGGELTGPKVGELLAALAEAGLTDSPDHFPGT